MRKSTARELRMLRMIAHYFLPTETCCFCHKPLKPTFEEKCFDQHQPTPIEEQIGFHHDDGHPDGNVKGKRNNKRNNLLAFHRTCHKSFELKRRWELQRAVN